MEEPSPTPDDESAHTQEKRRIAVFFEEPGYDDPPFDDEEFRQSYFDVGAAVTRRGGRFFIVRGEDSYRGAGLFARGWEYGDGAFAEREDVRVDVAWNKDYFADPGLTVINEPAFEAICKDKTICYSMFHDLCPSTHVAGDAAALEATLNAIGTDVVVAKPVDGGLGRGVFIGPKAEIGPSVVSFPYLIQEFIDTSGGIPGLVEGRHDFRILCVRGTVVASYIRTPPDGSFVANVSKGGREITVPVDKIPAEAMDILRTVDAALTTYATRLYSLDLGRDVSGKWKIIELNSKPGPPTIHAGAEYRRFIDAVADLLLTAPVP